MKKNKKHFIFGSLFLMTLGALSSVFMQLLGYESTSWENWLTCLIVGFLVSLFFGDKILGFKK